MFKNVPKYEINYNKINLTEISKESTRSMSTGVVWNEYVPPCLFFLMYLAENKNTNCRTVLRRRNCFQNNLWFKGSINILYIYGYSFLIKTKYQKSFEEK